MTNIIFKVIKYGGDEHLQAINFHNRLRYALKDGVWHHRKLQP